MPLVTNISHLNELITLVSYTMGNVNGVPVSNVRKEHFTTWALVLSQYLSEVRASVGTKLEDTVTFIVRYDQPETILNSWSIEWQGKQYDIVKLTPDTAKKQWTTIIGKPVANK